MLRFVGRLVLLAGVIGILPGSGFASILDQGDHTFDDATNLKWLDWSETTGLSYNHVSSQFGVGGDYEGYRYARVSEISVLFTNYGLAGGPWQFGPHAPVAGAKYDQYSDLVKLLGITFERQDAQTGVYHLHANAVNGRARDGGHRFTMVTAHLGGMLSTAPIVAMVGAGTIPDDAFYVDIGHALVKTAAVPEPASAIIWLVLGLGVVGYCGSRRRGRV